MDFTIDDIDELIKDFDTNRERIGNILEENNCCKDIYPLKYSDDDFRLQSLKQEKFVFEGLKVLKKMFKKLNFEDKSTHFAIRYDLEIHRGNLSSATLHKAKDMNRGYFIGKPYIRSMTVETRSIFKEMWLLISEGQNYTYIFTTNRSFLPPNIEEYPDIFLVTDVIVGFTDRMVKLSISQIN
jgi:hypothetical protein